MAVKKSGSGIPGALWKKLASVKLTVAVLLTIAVTAVIGTLIPQNKPPAYYQEHFGETIYHLLSRLNFTDMYHSYWFQALLLLLAVNIIACSLDRIKGVLRIAFSKTPEFSPAAFGESSAAEPITVEAPLTALSTPCRKLLDRQFSKTFEQQTGNEIFLFAETGRFSRLGVYVVHLSILVLLAGALIGSWFGFEGYVALPEGRAADYIFLTNSGKKHDLEFTVRCDAFSVAFHETGQPKEYRSSLAIFEKDRLVLEKDILVNKPLRFKGVGIFQSSYGTASAKNIDLVFISRKTGMQYHRTINIGEKTTIPEGLGVFTATRLITEYLFQGKHNVGEALIGMLERDGHQETVALPLNFPEFDRMRQGDVVISVISFEPVYYTGLQMRKDPGVPVVYTGFLLIIAGIYATFFLSHRKYCVRLTGGGDETTVRVYCKANKNQSAARKKADPLAKKLARLETPLQR